jgi:hypothetical protein
LTNALAYFAVMSLTEEFFFSNIEKNIIEAENLPALANRSKTFEKRPNVSPKSIAIKHKFVSDDEIDFIQDFKKSARSSPVPGTELVELGKRKRKKTWKLRLSEQLDEENSRPSSPSTPVSTDSDPDDDCSLSSDVYEPDI